MCSTRPAIIPTPTENKTFGSPIACRALLPHGRNTSARPASSRVSFVRASTVDSYGSSFDFVNRMEKTWLIAQVALLPFSFSLTFPHL